MAMLFASAARSGQVHVFEPIALNAALIRANSSLNGFSNIEVNNVAVGTVEGEVEFSVSVDSAYSSMIATHRRHESQLIKVPVVSLDEYIEKQSIRRVDILKIDVEGAERLVLEGARNLLSDPTRRPRAVLLELFDDNLRSFGTSAAECLQKMVDFGYRPHAVRPGSGELVPFKAKMTNKVCNVIFTCVG
jgi:FkbM family methyltransferase